MEEVDELRAKAIASMSTHVNSVVSNHGTEKSILKKEEGELSSSEGQGLPHYPISQATGGKSSFPRKPCSMGKRNGPAPGSGKHPLTFVSPSSSTEIHPRGSTAWNDHKRFATKRLHSNPKIHHVQSRYMSSKADNNLVISFDDSETESDGSKDTRSTMVVERKEKLASQEPCAKPVVIAQTKSSILSQVAPSQPRTMPVKMPSSRASVSVLSKINKNNSRGFRVSSGRGTHLQRPDTTSKTLPRKKCEISQDTMPTYREVESLRQQIAIREHELKRKIIPQSKGRIMNSDDGSRRLKSVPTNSRQLSIDEPEKKRMRIAVSSLDKLDVDCQLPLVPQKEANSTYEKQILESKEQEKSDEQFFQLSENPHAGANDGKIFTSAPSSTSQGLNASKQHPSNSLTCDIYNNHNQSESRLRSTTKHMGMTSDAEGAIACTDPSLVVRSVSPYSEDALQYLAQPPISESYVKVDTKSLMNIEELLDKELEEAQELRRKCELEERAALKAYRNAQRALIDANNKCTYLYGQRELLSAKIRTFVLEGSSSSWSSRWQKHRDIGFEMFRDAPTANADLLQRLSRRIPSAYEDQERCQSTIQGTGHGSCHVSLQHLRGQTFGRYNQVSEPDGSTSEVLVKNTANGICSPSHHPSFSIEEDDGTFPSDKEMVHTGLAKEAMVKHHREKLEAINKDMEIKSSNVNAQDTRLLEASLRSELFARLGTKSFSKASCVSSHNACPEGSGAHSSVVCEKASVDIIKSSVLPDQQMLEAEQNQVAHVKGVEGVARVTDQCLCDRSSTDDASHGSTCLEASNSVKDHREPTAFFRRSLPSHNLRTIFKHLRSIIPCKSDASAVWKNGDNCEGAADQDIFREIITQTCIAGSTETEFHTKDLVADPLWPLCMFELRGRCNNDDCSLQHRRDYRKRSSKPLDITHSVAEKYAMRVPIYWLGVNLMKADLYLYGNVLAHYVSQYWRSEFCATVVPLPVERILSSHVACLGPADGCIKLHESWGKPSIDYKDTGDDMGDKVQSSNDPEHALELALNHFKRNRNKQDGTRKALVVLSRALEADPNSVFMWIIYLHIFYRNENAVGKDDMFLVAVQHNKCSYELWLMYINSRLQFEDRLEAYNNALKAFTEGAHAADVDNHYASSCLLDLSLQMMEFLCMSGNVDKAISRILQLCSGLDSVSSPSAMLVMLECLSVSARSTLWVCFIYIIVYKRLPREVLQRLEFEQELPFGIEWFPTRVVEEERDQALRLIELAMESVKPEIDNNYGDAKKEVLRSVHLLAVSHIRCVEVLESSKYSLCLLHKYRKMYPTCLEIVLMWARLQNDGLSDGVGLEGFEEVLCDCSEDFPWIHCLWNQYAEFALENREVRLVEKLIDRWFRSVWGVQSPETRGSEDKYLFDESSETCTQPFPRDSLFGLMNLSLHHLLHGDMTGAQKVMDRVLSLATSVEFSLCAKSHAAIQIADGSISMKDHPCILIRYLLDVRASNSPETISRRSLKSIKKPKLQHLIDCMLYPISLDSCIMNSLLEVWYGPSLLPETYGSLSCLVDFVEALMLIRPANYHLALSVCKHVESLNLSGVSHAASTFWANTLLVNSILQTTPVAPEWVWVEASVILGKGHLMDIVEWFYQVAVSVYPFSLKLWQSYFNICSSNGKSRWVAAAAGERGFKLG